MDKRNLKTPSAWNEKELAEAEKFWACFMNGSWNTPIVFDNKTDGTPNYESGYRTWKIIVDTNVP